MTRTAPFAAVAALAALLVAAPAAPTRAQEPRWRFGLRPGPVYRPVPVPLAPTPVPPALVPADPVEPAGSAFDEVRRRADLKDLQEFNVFRAATPPLKLGRAVPEWERARYLILAAPAPMLDDRELFRPFAEIVKHALEVTDVLVLIDDKRPSHLKRLVRLLEDHRLGDRLVAPYGADAPARAPGYRIHAVPVDVDTFWIRDYGPAFATTAAGKLCVLDTMYRDLRAEQQASERVSAPVGTELGKSGSRPDDDRVPTVLATALANRFLGEQVPVVRAPLQLPGGDYFADGAGTAFTSTSTLTANGGDPAWVNRLFKEYLGAERVVYLEPLPGDTIKHIDMFLRPVDGTTFLLAEYPDDVPASAPYFDLMHKDARRTLERNADILRAKVPGAKLIRVPMPPLQFPADRAAVVASSEAVLLSIGLDPDDYDDDEVVARALKVRAAAEPSKAKRMMQQVAQWRKDKRVPATDEFELLAELRRLSRDIALAERKTFGAAATSKDREDLERLRARGREVRLLLERHLADLRPYYYTHLNALHLRGADKEKVLVPGYALHERMEDEVRERFQQAYPKAEVVFVPSDKLIRQFGAVHCMTCVLPDHRPPAKP